MARQLARVCQPEGRKGQNALTLSDGRAGLLALCKRSGCAFRAIAVAAGIAPGTITPPDPAILARRQADRRAEADKRARQAQVLWREAGPIAGTAAERYLRDARGTTCPLPPTLRFHGACWHGSTARRYPAMIAAVQGAALPAVHRTWLRADGSGKAGLDGGDKLMLEATAGGAVRLSDGLSRLVVAGERHRNSLVACLRLAGRACGDLGGALDFGPSRAAPSRSTGAADDSLRWPHAGP